jgi:hypothetical protein
MSTPKLNPLFKKYLQYFMKRPTEEWFRRLCNKYGCPNLDVLGCREFPCNQCSFEVELCDRFTFENRPPFNLNSAHLATIEVLAIVEAADQDKEVEHEEVDQE